MEKQHPGNECWHCAGQRNVVSHGKRKAKRCPVCQGSGSFSPIADAKRKGVIAK